LRHSSHISSQDRTESSFWYFGALAAVYTARQHRQGERDDHVSGLTNFTVAAWVNPAANSTWSRVFDFGAGITANMFLTVSASTRAAVRHHHQRRRRRATAQRDLPLPLNTWPHVAVTVSGNTGTLVVNGNAVATNTGMTLHPANLGTTTQNWIAGRSTRS
jgi:hypothetical protein